MSRPYQARKELADAIADHLLKTREDALPVSEEIADAVYELIDALIEARTGAY